MNNRDRNKSPVPWIAAGAFLLAFGILFTQVRQNSIAILEATEHLSTQSAAARALVQENDDLRALTNPKVILIIGDGMDDQQITMARNYLVGSYGKLNLDHMPFRGAALVQGVSEQDPQTAVYISDSANTATAMASGVTTSPKRIATTAGADQDITTIMEMAQAAGVGTGVVTTATVTDATPAAFIAHISDRLCQVPVDMFKDDSDLPYSNRDCRNDSIANGGPGSIAEQIALSEVNVVFGGGSGLFEHASETDPETSIADIAESNGYELIDDPGDLKGRAVGSKALGLFAPYTMPVRMRGADDAEAQRVERLNGQPQLPDAFACEANPKARRLPTLAEMTDAAIDQLDKHERFMLMIESASIDKEAHRRRPCGHIGEVRQLDEALRVALDYAASRPEVLIIVTADHGQAAHIIPETSRWAPQNHASIGHFARLRTPEGAVMGINYATNDARQEEHTGVQVPVYASGFGANRLPTLMSQTEIFLVMAGHLSLAD